MSEIQTISPAEYVIRLFGGVRATATALDRAPTTVQGWRDRGTIPQGHWQDVMVAAARAGRALSIEDFVRQHPVPEEAA